MSDTKRNDFSKGSIPGTITRLALPMIGAQLLNALYNIVDRMYIGRIADVGKLALTGIGVTFPFIMIVTAFTNLAGMGGAPISSIARGEGKEDYAEKVMGNSFSLLLLFGVVITIVGLLVRTPVLMAFGASSDTFPYANDYIGIYLLGSLFVMIGLGMNPFINSQGFARTGMMTVTLGAVCNICLDPLFIFVLNMGVRGAALATIISQAIAAAWVMKFLTGPKAILKLKLSNIRLNLPIVKRICTLGLSNFTMGLTESTVQIVCNTNLQAFGGDNYVAVMTVISSIRQMLMMPLNGFGQGAQPVIGYNYGAKQYDRVRHGIRFTTFACMAYATIAWGIVMLIPEWTIRMFSNDATLLQVGVPSIRIYFGMFFALCLQMAGQTSFVALGKSKQAIFFSLLRKAFIVVPLAIILPRIGFGVNGVFIAEPISDLVGSAACYLTLMLTVYKNLKSEPLTRA